MFKYNFSREMNTFSGYLSAKLDLSLYHGGNGSSPLPPIRYRPGHKSVSGWFSVWFPANQAIVGNM